MITMKGPDYVHKPKHGRQVYDYSQINFIWAFVCFIHKCSLRYLDELSLFF